MGSASQVQLERAELDAIVQSGLFHRAPNLASILRYVCERHFEGAEDQIKEYTIAVEALGRDASFDQKRDSIVRVEVHRLRKRLSDYYQDAGREHPVHIVIPNGQYAPQFRSRDARLEPLTTVTAAELTVSSLSGRHLAKPIPVHSPIPRRHIAFVVVAALVLGAAIAAAYWKPGGKPQRGTAVSEPDLETWKGVSTDPVSSEFRLLAGYHGAPFTDRQGRTWNADSHYAGGQSSLIPVTQAIECLPDPRFPRSFRSGRFTYNIPLRKGIYELHLYFIEPRYGLGTAPQAAETSRLFRVLINGVVKLDPFDVLSEAGTPNRALERVFKDIAPGPDGALRLEFVPLRDSAILNALEILPSLPHRTRPVRIVARPNSVTDADGQTWMADRDFLGGFAVVRKDSVTNVREWSLYDGERYGNFSYRIPLAPGKYRVCLHFAETWFGRPEAMVLAGLTPTTAPTGLRIFNVFANGTTLLRNFDIAKAAGGAHRGIAKVFGPLEPNAQGLLILEFVPDKNYACVNAIEVEEID